MRRKSLFFVLPLFALILGGCVKYNGKGSANPVDPADVPHITLSTSLLQLEEGKSASLAAEVDQDCKIYWDVSETQKNISISSTEGNEITVSALKAGTTKVTARATNKGIKAKSVCTIQVSTGTSPGPGPGPTPVDPDPTDPVVGEKVTTYLVIGENGRYNGEPGKDIPELYLEYAVEFTAEVGADLPGADVVTTMVSGSSFQYWQAYDGGGALTKYEKVPNARGKILYACFGGGSGSVDPDPDVPVPTGSVTIYFAGLAEFANTTVNLGVNDTLVVATSQGSGIYKATVQVSGNVKSINAYMAQNDGGVDKYFHPFSGLQDWDVMNSKVNTGSVALELEKEYTITFTGWAYSYEDFTHAWFTHTFAAGSPGQPEPGPTPPGPSEDTVTLWLMGVTGWNDISEVGFAINDSWKTTTTKTNGSYKIEFTVSSAVTSVNCYFKESENTKFRHPTYEPFDWDTDYSTINTGSITVTAGHSYAVQIPSDGTWAHVYDNWEHAWFNYSFVEIA